MVNLFGWFSKWQITKGLSVALLGLSLISCSDTDGPPEDLFGVAAAGAAIQGSVTLVDAAGASLSKTINVDGSFKLDVRQMTAPFMLKTVASNGLDPNLYSYAAESNVIVNITPLTTVAMYLANGNADPGILYDSWASTFVNITPIAVEEAQARVNANLFTQFTAFSLDALTYDFFATRFYANGTSIDGLLDALTVDISAGVNIAVAGLGTLVFDDVIDISGYDIGGTNVAIAGNYTVKLKVSVNDGVASTERYLSINYPADLLPTINDQNVRDLFSSFYGTEGSIVINSVTPTVDDLTPTTVYAVVDATITTVDDDIVSYLATYTYTLNP